MALPSLAPGELVRIRDERWVVTRQTSSGDIAVLDVCGRDWSNREARASFLLPFEIVEPLPSSDLPRLVRRRQWRRLVRSILASATPSWQSLRTPLAAHMSLMPFQLEPALAVTHGMAARILIADEVGLGKTIQAALVIAELLARRRDGRVLIVAPASLRDQWQTELRERFGIRAWVADSSSLAHLAAVWRGIEPWAAHEVTITSIDFVKRAEVMRSLESLIWDVVVFDEAHGLTGRSDRAVAAGALANRGRTIVLLTATPHDGNDAAFASLCRIGDSTGEFPLLVFRRTRQELGLSISRRTIRLRVRPTLAELEMHRALEAYARRVHAERGEGSEAAAHLAMTVLTRRACSSAASLARSVERRLHLLHDTGSALGQLSLPIFDSPDDDEPGVELAAPGLDDGSEERRRLQHILLLAQRAQQGESKLRALVRLLGRTTEPAIVFTQYRDTLTRLAAALQAWCPSTLHGGMTAAERRDSLHRFTSGDARLLLATDAASEGLNLHYHCRLVINLELPWTPIRVEQRIGRVERIGQRRRVHAVHLLAAGTAEESYVARFLSRAGHATDVLGALRPSEQSAAPVDGLITSSMLRPMAAAETARLHTLRGISKQLAVAPVAVRPPVIVCRRRRLKRSLFGYLLSATDSTQRVEWHTLVGVKQSGGGSTPLMLPPTKILETYRRSALDSLTRALRGYDALGLRRERVIALLLEREHARLSAQLLQPGLFDRRVQRSFSAQAAVLEEAQRRCRIRFDEIAASETLLLAPPRLAFALLVR